MTTLRNKVAALMSNQPYPFAECVITASGNDYAIEVAMGNNTYWCADSESYVGESNPEDPAPSGAFGTHSWSGNRICNSNLSCGGNSRTICDPI